MAHAPFAVSAVAEARVTPLAVPLALRGTAVASDDEAGRLLHPRYRPGLARFPHGTIVSRGLPFQPPGGGGAARWIVLDGPRRIALEGVPATWLVLLHFCDAWRDEHGERPSGVPLGWVMPVGEPLARARVLRSDGTFAETTLRRRFEVNEGLIGWGSMAFLALPHLVERPQDWRGPHARQGPGRSAPPGHAGPLAILPGTWGGAQTGVTDNVPSATDELMLWLYALDVRAPDGRPAPLEAIELLPLPGEGQGRTVVLAAITAYSGPSSPLRWRARRALRLTGASQDPLSVDLGLLARRAPLEPRGADDSIRGWGVLRVPGAAGMAADSAPLWQPEASAETPLAGDELVELTAADDAVIHVAGRSVPLAGLQAGGPAVMLGTARVEALPALDRRVHVSVREADGRPTATRVRVLARDGRVLAPEGHRREVNPAICEDSGGDLLLGRAQYAYVAAEFAVEVPPEGASLEIVHGFDVPPVLVEVLPDEAGRGGPIEVRLAEPLRPEGGHWISADTHVHFLAPSSALLQAEAEGVNVVHLLATQWGDHHTGTTDIGGDLMDAAGRHAVWLGSENRQNMLGHVGLVGTRRPLFPFVSGGPPEGPIGAPVSHLMADWLAACREQGGLAIGAHFPLPMAEIAADIEAGLLDALEMQCFDETLESPPIREWYRYLDAGYRLPLVGGTDKMSAAVPLGQVRTWARLDEADELSFAAWARSVRAGRTFVSSGPLLELRVEGLAPGDVLRLGGDASIEVELRARAAQPIVEALEIVLGGQVVAARSSAPTSELVLRERIAVTRSGWLAGRSRSSLAIGSAFASAMAAHTSPVYVEVAGRPQPPADLSVPLAIVDGTRAWLEALAPVRDGREAERFRAFLDEAERRLQARGSG